MTYSFHYIAVKSTLHSSESNVFGLLEEEVNALVKRYGGDRKFDVVNGISIKAPPMELINALSELGYKVVCCSGENMPTWTMMSKCRHSPQNSTACQTLDELDFERGIWFAAQHNDITKVKQWINKKDVNATDKYGYTALHYASRNGHLEICKLLVSHGADVNALTACGKVSPLHRCASMGHYDILCLLIDSGASVDVKDGDGKTILHRAIEGGHINVVEKILEIKPALAKEADNKGCLPKEYPNISQEILDVLNKFGMND